MDDSEATTVHAAPGVLEKIISKAITEALLERNITSPSLLRSGGCTKFTAAQLSQMVDQEEYSNSEFEVSLVPTSSHDVQPTSTAEELKQHSQVNQSVNSLSILALALLFGSVSCLTTVGLHSIRLSNINACNHMAVSNQSLSGDNRYLVSGYSNKTITAVNTETSTQYANEHDNVVSMYNTVMFPILNNNMDAGVTIFDPGGLEPRS
jgi:glutathione peroxidase-family protein